MSNSFVTQFLLMREFDELLDNDYALSISLFDSISVDVGKKWVPADGRTDAWT